MEESWVRGSAVQIVSIVLILALFSPPVFAGSLCFDAGQSDRLLEEVEVCREQLPALRDLVTKDAEVDQIQRERIKTLEEQRTELIAMNEAAIKQAELAQKAGKGSWWERGLAAGKWIGLGIVLGFVAGAAK
jgi:hypothetical protein